MPWAERDVVHGIDRDFALRRERSHFDQPSPLFGFGEAVEFCPIVGHSLFEFLRGDVRELSSGFLRGGCFRFHFGRSHAFGFEVSDDSSGVADSNLNVGFEFYSSPRECRLPFLKNTAHTAELTSPSGFDGWNCVV
jgi:hypothetical protein